MSDAITEAVVNRNNDMDLIRLRAQHEGRREPLMELPLPNDGHFLVVLQAPDEGYDVIRYTARLAHKGLMLEPERRETPTTCKWEACFDGRNMSAESVFSWIQNPRPEI